MIPVRIIPCLDIDNNKVVKGIGFKNIEEVGDPVKFAKKYQKQKADELVFLDIGAGYKKRKTLLKLVEKVAKNIFIPFTVGGGIKNIQDIRKIIQAGADKVSICSAAIDNPEIITQSAAAFGSQCIVISIDAKLDRKKDEFICYKKGGREKTDIKAVDFAEFIEKKGAGEILLNSIDNDGTKKGYNLKLINKVKEKVNIPVISSGGAGKIDDIITAYKNTGSKAFLLASLLHRDKKSIKDIKKELKKKGVPVR